MKRYTEKKACAMFNKVLSYIRKYHSFDYAFSDAWKDENGNGYVTDGYRIYQLFAGIPNDTMEIWSVHKISDEQRQENQKLQEKIVQYTIKQALSENYTIIDKPTEQYIREHRETVNGNKAVFMLSENLYFNYLYLLDIYTLFPDCKLYTNKSKGSVSPLLAVSNFGYAFILPVRVFR